jgi:hypothetical protein
MINLQRSASLSTAILFFIWIIPLGAFISSSQAKLVCNGKRAICCCGMKAQAKSTPAVGFCFQNNPNSNNETNGSGGAGEDYLAAQFSVQGGLRALFSANPAVFVYNYSYIRPVDHVPLMRISLI